MSSLERLDSIRFAKSSNNLIRVESGVAIETNTSSPIEMSTNFREFTLKQWGIVGMLACANLLSTVAFSCISPFFPGEARKKSLNTAETGIIFGIFELVMLVTSPLFGKYVSSLRTISIYNFVFQLHLFGPRKVFSFGLFFTGITNMAFGFLNLLPDGRVFFWASLGTRCAEALGDAAFVTSSFVISARCFPGKISTIVGVMEVFAGLGFAVGPVIGGMLYEYGGFQLPLLVLGSLLVLATIFSLFLIEEFDGLFFMDVRNIIISFV